MTPRQTVAVIGAGRIGRALGAIIQNSGAGVTVRWWDSKPALVDHPHPLTDTLRGADVVILAVPSLALPSLIDDLVTVSRDTIIATIAKGAPNDTDLSPAEYLLKHLPDHEIIVIGGPMMAEELAPDRPGFAVVAGNNPSTVKTFAALLEHPAVRVTTSADPVSVSRAGVLKNAYGFTSGLFDSLTVPNRDNIRHRLVVEYRLVANHLHIPDDIIEGPAGVGDLLTTMTSPHSRNRRAGENIGRTGHDEYGAEAVHSLPAITALLGDVAAPCLRAANQILGQAMKPAEMISLL